MMQTSPLRRAAMLRPANCTDVSDSSSCLRRDAPGSRPLDLFFGAEPVFHIVTVLPPALFVKFVSALSDVILDIRTGMFLPD